MEALIPIQREALDTIARLNNLHVIELSWLDREQLWHLVQTAYYARMTPSGSAFLIALAPEADYDSPNFLRFRNRIDRFIYIDRIAVAPEARGRGLARALYADLFSQAARDGHTIICCEVNLDPPNLRSDTFHAALGFQDDGHATIPSGKTVRYLIKTI